MNHRDYYDYYDQEYIQDYYKQEYVKYLDRLFRLGLGTHEQKYWTGSDLEMRLAVEFRLWKAVNNSKKPPVFFGWKRIVFPFGKTSAVTPSPTIKPLNYLNRFFKENFGFPECHVNARGYDSHYRVVFETLKSNSTIYTFQMIPGTGAVTPVNSKEYKAQYVHIMVQPMLMSFGLLSRNGNPGSLYGLLANSVDHTRYY